MSIILNTAGFIEKLNSRIPERLKEALNFACFFLVFTLHLFIYSLDTHNRWMPAVLSGSFVFLALILLNIKRDTLSRFRMKKPYFILIEIIGFSFLINGLYFSTRGYIAVGLVFSFLLPLAHMSLAQIGIAKAAKLFSKAAVLSFIILLPMMLLFAPPLGYRYTAFYDNTNLFGNYLCTVYCGLLFLVFIHRRRGFRKNIFLYVLMAADLSFCFFTASRTSLMSLILLSTVFLIILLVLHSRERHSGTWAVLGKTLIGALIILPLVLFLCIGIFTGLKMRASGSEPDLKQDFQRVSNYIFKGIETEDDDRNGREHITVDYDNFSSGRTGIWKQFLENLSFSGHASEEREVYSGARHYKAANAHNVYIQLAYSGGIICGAAILLLVLLCGADILGRLINEMRTGILSRETVFAGLALLGFLLPSLTSSGYMLFSYLPSTLFWTAISGLTTGKKDTGI